MSSKPYETPTSLTEQLLNLCWSFASKCKLKIDKTEAVASFLPIEGKAIDATKADFATKAAQDASGNNIISTYALKTSLPSVMEGASKSAAGAIGLVPKPGIGGNTRYLRGDGTWQNPTADLDEASDTVKGLLSKDLHKKLINIEANAEVNQNALASVKVGETTLTASSKQDSITIEAGDGVTLSLDPETKKMTIQQTYIDSCVVSSLDEVPANLRNGGIAIIEE